MQPQQPRRRRGVILTPVGLKKLKNAINALEYRDNFGEKYTLEALSERTRLDPVTIAKVLETEEGVDKRTLERFFRAVQLELDSNDYIKLSARNTAQQQENVNLQPSIATHSRQDLSEAVDVSVFYGRQEELEQLEQWIVNDRCRLVAILGMGGMGKTALSVKLAEQIGQRFEYVIWRSLRNAPLIQDILATLIQFLSDQQETELPTSTEARIARLLDYLRQHRCLLILDNVDSMLQSGSRTGRYRQGYEAYGELFKCIGETIHQSCLLLTSREKPREVALLEGQDLSVRTWQLRGLKEAEAQAILRVQGLCSGTDAEWRVLIEYYAGNPLALKMIAPGVQVFDTVTAFLEFLQRGNLIFEDIRDLLDRQFERLSELEKEVMYWLAIHRELISFSQLRGDVLPPVSERRLLEAIITLEWRSLIERSATLFTLQPVMMEYVTERLVEQMCEEITTERINLFRRHAIVQVTAEESVRDAQIRFIVRPIIDRLLEVFIIKSNLENQLTQILTTLQAESPLEVGYAGDNISSLLNQMQTDLRGDDR